MRTIKASKPKARKEHVCNYCYNKIKIGEIYNYFVNVYDGDLYDWKNHISCGLIASQLRMFDNADEGLTADDFIQEILNEFQKLKPKLVGDEYEIPHFDKQLTFVLKHYNLKSI